MGCILWNYNYYLTYPNWDRPASRGSQGGQNKHARCPQGHKLAFIDHNLNRIYQIELKYWNISSCILFSPISLPICLVFSAISGNSGNSVYSVNLVYRVGKVPSVYKVYFESMQSIQYRSQTGQAGELNFERIFTLPCVTYHVSHFMCHVSCAMRQVSCVKCRHFLYIYFVTVVELVNGVSATTRPTPSKFLSSYTLTVTTAAPTNPFCSMGKPSFQNNSK